LFIFKFQGLTFFFLQVLHDELKKEGDFWERKREEWEQSSPPRGARPYYRKRGFNKEQSTRDVMAQLERCASKGCLSDSRSWEKLYTDLGTGPKTKLTKRLKKSESVKNETWHRIANMLVMKVSTFLLSLSWSCQH
jgi:hypothetical protein